MYIHTLYRFVLFYFYCCCCCCCCCCTTIGLEILDWTGLDWILIFLLRYLQDSSLNFTPPPPLHSAASRERFETLSIQLPLKRSERINHRQTNAQVVEKFPLKETTRLKQWQQPQQAPSSPPGTPATKPTPYSSSSAQYSAGPSFPPYVPPQKKKPPLHPSKKKSNPQTGRNSLLRLLLETQRPHLLPPLPPRHQRLFHPMVPDRLHLSIRRRLGRHFW